MATPKRPRGRSSTLPVYICEYHHEALRCLHYAIRRRRVPFDGLTMVHLDAHPDLAASTTMPAETVFQAPQDLHFALKQDAGGIAQWILPAVYGGHLQCLWWVRPSWARQIDDGDYHVAVGRAMRSEDSFQPARARDARAAVVEKVADAPVPASVLGVLEKLPDQQDSVPETIRISCNEPYFVEDGTFCPADQLKGSKQLRLLVSQLPSSTCLLDGETTRGKRLELLDLQKDALTTWTLDICLDFFACGNPFLAGVRPEIAAPFAAVQDAASFRKGPVADVERCLADRDAFEAAYLALLKDRGAAEEDDAPHSEDEDASPGNDPFLEALGAFLPQNTRGALLQELDQALERARGFELRQLLEAGDMVTLPLNAAKEQEVRERLSAFDAFLGLLCEGPDACALPSMVTVARSVVDGFCPMRWLCLLESGVMEVLRRRFGDLEVVYSDELDLLDAG